MMRYDREASNWKVSSECNTYRSLLCSRWMERINQMIALPACVSPPFSHSRRSEKGDVKERWENIFWSIFFHSTDKESKRDFLPHSHNNVWSRSEKAELFVWVFNFMILYHNVLVVLGRRTTYRNGLSLLAPIRIIFVHLAFWNEWMT